MATLSVIAGPNGSGKSTLTASLSFEGRANLIDPDAIARRMNPIDPARRAIPAAREAIVRCKTVIEAGATFVLETTLAGNGAISLMRQANRRGYRIYLVYVALGHPDLHIERVRLRVALGGHDVPEATFADVTNEVWRKRLTHCAWLMKQLFWITQESIPVAFSHCAKATLFGSTRPFRNGVKT